jgi:hypothetical protein
MEERRGSLGSTKISRALTDPISKPYFQRIREGEEQDPVGDAGAWTSERSSENGFSTRRRRAMIRWRHSRLRSGGGHPDSADFDTVAIPATVTQAPSGLTPDNVPLPDSLLITDGPGDDMRVDATEDDTIRVKIVDAINMLDRYAVPIELGEKKADQLLKEHGESIVRTALRAAIKERRQIA